MEKMVVVIFDDISQAKDGMLAIRELDREGAISVHDASLVKKKSDGTAELLKTEEAPPAGMVGGTAVGILVGLLGGPVGVFVGASSGVLLGGFYDLYRSGVSAEFLDDVSSNLTPGKYAVVADISEEYVTPLDNKMTSLGGQIMRTAKRYVEVDQIKGDIAALDSEINQLSDEMHKARMEDKAKLQAKIDKLKEKREKKIGYVKQRTEQIEKERDAKVQGLKEKATKAHGERKAVIEARVTQIRKQYQETLTKLRKLQAERLEKSADKLKEKAKQLRGQGDQPS